MILFIVYSVVLIIGFWQIVSLVVKLDRRAQMVEELESQKFELERYVERLGDGSSKTEETEMAKVKLSVRDVVAEVLKIEGKKNQINVADGMEFMKCLRQVLKKTKGVDLYRVIHE